MATNVLTEGEKCMKKVSHGRMRKIKENRRLAEIRKLKFRILSSRNCGQEVLGKWSRRLNDAIHMDDPIYQRMRNVFNHKGELK